MEEVRKVPAYSEDVRPAGGYISGGSQSSSDINIKEIAFIFIVYNGSWRYHLIIIDSIAEAVSE